ncbi:hypothetical protein Hypma_003240 [Hypsizygus marmoreus]|uniref:Uncharacterized protein n=1 Tax=Hypsizygus marmoreus TaxID=39966 RepID=A0A369JZJ2_HYPMA|nr:hypothetical protein Hypma_003240 [Hypsizygus marmoreus]
MAPSPRTLELIAVMCESILVGAYSVLVALVIWLLVYSEVHTGLHSYSDVHVIQYEAAHDAHDAQDPIWGFVIGDLVLIWRVWVVWGRNYWVALPPLIIMIISAGLTFNLASFHEFRTFFTVAPAALIVANTSICTILIAGKIWYARYQLRNISGGAMYGGGGFQGTVALFIESGVLYATCQLLSLILDHIKSDGIHILLDLEMPLIGILPTLIIVFVHFELVGVRTSTASSSIPRSMRFQDRDRVHLDTFASSITANSKNARGGLDPDAKVNRYPDPAVSDTNMV